MPPTTRVCVSVPTRFPHPGSRPVQSALATVAGQRSCSRAGNVTTYLVLFSNVSLQPSSSGSAVPCNTTLLGVPKNSPE